MAKFYIVFLVIVLSSCYYGINERTSAISDINYSCVSLDWDEMKSDHSIANIKDSSFLKVIASFESKPFDTELFYFSHKPQEIIAISTDHYQIRYVYNSELSRKVLDGFSKKLDQKEVDRISERIYGMLEKYGCIENQ